MLAAFYWVIDVCGFRRWSLPLVVVGVNSIAIYLMSQLMKPFVAASLRTHFGPIIFRGPYGPLVQGLSVLVVLWLICFWLYKPKDLHQDLKTGSLLEGRRHGGFNRVAHSFWPCGSRPF